MAGYGQFCAVARAHEAVGGRWTILVVRELLCGSRRFNDIRRGIPRISRTMLSERLQALTLVGAVARLDGAHGPEYALTAAGQELAGLVGDSAPGDSDGCRDAPTTRISISTPCWSTCKGASASRRCPSTIVVRVAIRGSAPRFLLLKRAEASLCAHNPGFPEPLCVGGPLAALVAWWRGDVGFLEAQRMGLAVTGPRALARAFPTWFERYQLAHVGPASATPKDRAARSASADHVVDRVPS